MSHEERPAQPLPDAAHPSDPALVSMIHSEIAQRGPITFARFMDLALYAPEIGYYTSAAVRIGRRGDFLTAPETHWIFGAAIARQVADVWRAMDRPSQFVVREYGAGSGALAEAIATELAVHEPDLAATLRYQAVEINGHRRDDLVRRLEAAAPALRFEAIDPLSAATVVPVAAADTGVVLANEYFDALPVHRVEQGLDGLTEIFVDWRGDSFVDVAGPPSTARLAARLATENVHLAPGQRAEIALDLDDWFVALAQWLRNGVVVAIDYGHEAAELYGPSRRAGTLLGYLGHAVVDDPLASVGRQDLTAHVDFTALEAAAAGAGFTFMGRSTQARFLMELGLEELLERARAEPGLSLGQYVELRAGVVRLLDPRHTGGFQVLALGRGPAGDQPLRGLRRSDE